MKKLLISLMALFLLNPCFTQQTSPSKISTDDYNEMIRQANAKRTTGLVLLSGGSALIITGLIVTATGMEFTDNGDGYIKDQSKVNTGRVLFWSGVVADIASIPVLVKGHKLRKQANLAFGRTSLLIPQNGSYTIPVPQAQITLTIPLGK